MQSAQAATPARFALLNKVPEVTVWFWIIKILCTTVGESFADWVSVDLGVGLINTTVIFTAGLAAVLFWQLRLPSYRATVYWLTVVVLSVTGTLYTDILTDKYGVPLALTTPLFAGLLAIVFATWYQRERTLSIHSIVSRPREVFYWVAILVTFALGTAAGDWTLELTGWSPGVSVLLPSFLILAIVAGWLLGANAVLSFWLAYILTRPLGANLGDYFALPRSEGGLGIGTFGTSAIFLAAILATVIYLVLKRPDVAHDVPPDESSPARRMGRERLMLGYYGTVATAALGVLIVANHRPHTSISAEEDPGGGSAQTAKLTAQQATASFPPSDIAEFRKISQDTIDLVLQGDQAGAKARIADLEKAWDQSENRLKPLNKTSWNFLDGEIDDVLSAVRSNHPDPVKEQSALGTLVASLTP
ncbi:MAG: hypothetical protein ABI577_00185 [bacterium]